MKTFKMTELYKSPQKVLPQSVEDEGAILEHESLGLLLLAPVEHCWKAANVNVKTFKITELYKSPRKVLPVCVKDGGVLLTHRSFDQPFLLVPLKHHTKAIEKYKEIQGVTLPDIPPPPDSLVYSGS